ncbi:hypothetical protein ACGF0D_20040 [Kitasatospora sp. NPDC048298]|uniref:hypothetical protein n=1 Tax=Kitasatospora sp. NPDC048298 TaxID=3364049 RepID=UPI0037167331
MATLNYEILTDPAPLQVPNAGEESRGTVYVIISNPNSDDALWYSTEIQVPVGDKDGDLTTDPKAFTPQITQNTATDPANKPATDWNTSTAVYKISSQDPRYPTLIKGGGSMVVAMEGFPVSSKPGLVLLRVTERAANIGGFVHPSLVTLSLIKQEAKVPRNFRAKDSLVAAGKDVVLQWDGPDTLTYQIQGPDGPPEAVPPRSGAAAGWQWSPKPGQEPKRDATYTLIASSPNGQQPSYLLTTTVHLRSPEFDSVTATKGVYTPWVEGTAPRGRIVFTEQGAQVRDASNAPGTVAAGKADVESVTASVGVSTPWVEGTTEKGRVTLTAQGVQVRDASNAPGTVAAAKADVDTVTAAWVRGRDSGSGWIQFPSDGITVGHGQGNDLGTVHAEKISVNGINTKWVGDRDSGKGWLDFPQSGVNVRKDGQETWGTVAADKADLNGVNTKWVQGRTSSDGWIEFPASGLNVFQGSGHREWGTVAADKADLNGVNTSWVQGRTSGDGWIEFPASGLNVFQGAGNRTWGTVAADKADLNDLVTDRAQVKQRLTLHGGLTVDNVLETLDGPPRLVVHGESEFRQKVNANGDLSVGGESVFAGKVNATGDLRVGGESAFFGKVNANRHLSVRTGSAWILHTNDDLVAINGNLRVHGAFRADK